MLGDEHRLADVGSLSKPVTCGYVVPPLGFEPRTCGLRVILSTSVVYRPVGKGAGQWGLSPHGVWTGIAVYRPVSASWGDDRGDESARLRS